MFGPVRIRCCACQVEAEQFRRTKSPQNNSDVNEQMLTEKIDGVRVEDCWREFSATKCEQTTVDEEGAGSIHNPMQQAQAERNHISFIIVGGRGGERSRVLRELTCSARELFPTSNIHEDFVREFSC